MGQVVAFAERRAEKLKAKLSDFAKGRTAAAVETRRGTVCAYRIFCRDGFVILIDRYGYQTVVEYQDITDAGPVLPMTDILRLADWDVSEAESDTAPVPAAVISFPGPCSR